MDDENPTEVTTGAIVTVTVTLVRKDMSILFGDETVEDKSIVNENNDVEVKDGSDVEQEHPSIKRPVWKKQRKATGKKSNKKTKQKTVIKHKPEESPAPVKTKTVKEEKPRDDDSDSSDSSASEINESNDASEDEVKNSSVEDEDQVKKGIF